MKAFINEYVEHPKYGRGSVISEDTGKIAVKFPSQTGNKLFQFPDAFEHYLRFEDTSLQEESLQLIKAKKQLIIEENEKNRLEKEMLEEERKKEEAEQKKKDKKATKLKTTKVKTTKVKTAKVKTTKVVKE